MSEIYQNLGIWTGIIAACVLLTIVQSLLFVLIGYFGKLIWLRLRRTYALHVIAYWLDRLEKEGTHTFEKVEQDRKGAA